MSAEMAFRCLPGYASSLRGKRSLRTAKRIPSTCKAGFEPTTAGRFSADLRFGSGTRRVRRHDLQAQDGIGERRHPGFEVESAKRSTEFARGERRSVEIGGITQASVSSSPRSRDTGRSS